MTLHPRLRRDGERIFRAALRAADPREAVFEHLYVPDKFDHIYVVGAGKAAGAMAEAVEKKLGRRINEGWVNVKDGHTASSCAASISTSAATLFPTSAASAAPRRSRASPRRRASGTWSSA